MKTIDLLVQALPSIGGWPNKVTSIGQDYDRELMFYGRGNVRTGIILDQLADDHRKHGETGVKITREQYVAALAAKNDGWIEWGGGECPVPRGTLVDVRYRDGRQLNALSANDGTLNPRDASFVFWRNGGSEKDIIAYRLHKTNEITEADDEADLNECIGQDVSQVWSGDGLPPAGCQCEYQYKVHGSEWCPLECVAVDGKAVFGWSNNTPVALRSNTHNFRPLRSEVDKKREEAIMSLAKAGVAAPFKYGEKLSDGQLLGSMWYELYDAIAAGKVRGVKLED